MEKLLPFSPHGGQFALSASLSVAGGLWHLKYELRDPSLEILGAPVTGSYEGKDVVRTGELWRETCFEAFWAQEKGGPYWELNLSPSGRKWGLYRFDGYRVPFPPVPSEDFLLERINIRDGFLDCVLTPQIALKNVEASLCAVLKTASDTHYLAVAHAGAKPDFHLRGSFCLRPGA